MYLLFSRKWNGKEPKGTLNPKQTNSKSETKSEVGQQLYLAMNDQFEVQISFKGKTTPLFTSLGTATGDYLVEQARTALQLPNTAEVKVLWKGKRLGGTNPVFTTVPKKKPKLMVLATEASTVTDINARRSDPLMRGFDNEKPKQQVNPYTDYWGDNAKQDKNYKFCRFEACSWQSFGHRPHDTETPHAFAAQRLLHQLATDPGIIAILRERQLVVGTLGEMDPIDDRLMQQKEKEGACLLGYNTNGGTRIDLKLRNDNLRGFRPYPELVSTLIHELSHNFFADHNLLFWTNHGHMRVEYLFHHTHNTGGTVIRGQTTSQLAGIPSTIQSPASIVGNVMQELTRDMAQHGLPATAIQPAIESRCRDMVQRYSTAATSAPTTTDAPRASPREMALRAAQARAKDHQQQQRKQQDKE